MWFRGKGNQMQKMAEQFGLYSDFCLAYPDAMLYLICCYTILYVILCHCMILCCDTKILLKSMVRKSQQSSWWGKSSTVHSHTWNPKQPFLNGCFNWMIPNLYIENGCCTKHPFINGCLGFQVDIQSIFGVSPDVFQLYFI